MSSCNEISGEIANLAAQVAALKNKLDSDKSKPNPNDPDSSPNLSGIYKRLDKIEAYISKLDTAGQKIVDLIPVVKEEVIGFVQLIVEGFIAGLLK
ncbi:hypothetical protein [Anabaena lutea]|uniref:Uncharacterized protein n=1 Tax=Anabaena lutea FACHB-196 TaxID=2692881 RepID=A0ABR8FLJ7_9NOST|nr:hypothetical protein [Anabaena lutea]MBD2569695.1 hypothetical protein [Anabaena lutea FACHB-196]